MALYEVPGMGNVEFPDNMPIEDVEKAIQASVKDQQGSSIADGVAREAGVAARGAINPISTGAAIGGALAAPTGVGIPVGMGAGALAGLLVELGADYYNKLIAPKLGTGKQMLPSEALDQLKDQLGLPKPETPIEKLTSGAYEAVSAMGPQARIGAMLKQGGGTAARVGEVLLDKPMQQAAAYGLSGGFSKATEDQGAVASTAAALAGAVVPSAPALIKAGTAGVLRGGVTADEIANNIRLFRDAGTEPTIGQATGSRPAQAAEMLLSKTPGGSGVMVDKAARQQEQIGQRIEQMASRMGGESDIVTAGKAIKRGVKEDFIPKQRAIQRDLYSQVDNYIDPNGEVPIKNTFDTVTRINEQILAAPSVSKRLSNPFLEGLESDLRKDAYEGNLPYKALRAIRTKIGDQLGEIEINPNISRAQLKQLYGALSDDLRLYVDQSGPQAKAAYNKADTFTKNLHERMDVLQSVIDRQSPEQIFQAAISGTREGYTRINSVMNSLPPDGKRALSAAFIRRLGRSVPSQQNADGDLFSTQTFIKNYSVLRPQARDALFGKFPGDFRRDLDSIAAASDRINQSAKVFENKSGTTQQAILFTTVGTVLGGMMSGNTQLAAGTLAGVGAANLGARLMTNPRAVKWLAQNYETPITALPAALNELTRIGKESKDEDVQDIARQLKASAVQRELRK